MKKTISILSFIAFFASSVFSQTPQSGVGIGVGLATGNTNGLLIRLPIVLDNIRVEPMLSFFINKNSDSYSDSTNGFLYSNSSENLQQSFFLGSGLYKTFHIDDKVSGYVGPFGGVSVLSYTSDNTTTETDSNGPQTGTDHSKSTSIGYSLGFALGGEYFFTSHFSLGAEASAIYAHRGEPTKEHIHTGTLSTSTSSAFGEGYTIAETTNIFIRWYF